MKVQARLLDLRCLLMIMFLKLPTWPSALEGLNFLDMNTEGKGPARHHPTQAEMYRKDKEKQECPPSGPLQASTGRLASDQL